MNKVAAQITFYVENFSKSFKLLTQDFVLGRFNLFYSFKVEGWRGGGGGGVTARL